METQEEGWPKEKVVEFYKELGGKIRILRIRAGLTQKDIGKRWRVTFQQVQKYETGANRIPLDKAIQLCEMTNYDIKELLDISVFGEVNRGSTMPVILMGKILRLNKAQQRHIIKTIDFMKGE